MQKIAALCEKTAGQMGYELCDAAIEKEPTGRYLRIYIDKEGGITLDDCEAFHRAVQPKLEDFDYDFLEVCSPGIDGPLKTKRDVEKSLGLLVEAKLYKALDGQKAVQGLLKGMDDEKVTLAVGETTVELPRKAVSQVRLVPDLSALDEEEE
jgi:ribosome maturation factor RimP